MPKIVRIINRFNLGGPTYNAAYLTKYMAPEFETILIGGANDDTEENSEFILNNLGITPIIIPEMKRSLDPRKDIIAYNKLKNILRDIKPDIVHTHASKAGALGRRAAIKTGVPVILHTFHGHVFDSYFGNIKSKFYINIEKSLAKKSSKIIAISDKQKEDLAFKYNICEPDKIAIIPLGFDLSKFQINMLEKRRLFRAKYQLGDHEIAVGIIGRLVPVKNHPLFLESIRYILDNTSKQVRFFIIGDGESRRSIEDKAYELNIPFVDYTKHEQKATLTFTSWIKDIDYVMAGMDIIALTSLNEGTPVSLIEAQAASKPIVTTNVGGIENIVIPNQTALLSENNNAAAFSHNLRQLIENDTLRTSLTTKGWQHVEQQFHYTRLVKDMSNLYYSLLNK